MSQLPEMVMPEDTDRLVGVRKALDGKMKPVRISWYSMMRALDQTVLMQDMRASIAAVSKQKGPPGDAGADAYQVAVAAGFSGSRTDWLASLKGKAGDAATIQVGTVSPLLAGAPPTVTNSGTAQAAKLDFGIPAGAAGRDGKDGTNGKDSITLLGAVTVSETAVVAILAGIRRVVVNVPAAYGVKVGQALILSTDAVSSTQYAVHDVYAVETNKISVGVSVPALAIGTSYSIPCRLHRLTA